MTDAVVESGSKSSSQQPQKWWHWWLMYPTLGVALLGAMPTANQLFQAFRIGSSYRQVPFLARNMDLFAKNFDCLKKSGDSIQLKNNSTVEVAICDSGDVWVRVTTADNQSTVNWLALADVGNKSSGMLGGVAFAASIQLLAQSGARPLCVFKDNSGKIIRRVEIAPGACRDEQIDPYTGRVIVVPANCSCPK